MRTSFIRIIFAVLLTGFLQSAASSVQAQSTGPIDAAYLAEQAKLIDFAGNPGALLIGVVEADGTITFTTTGENPDGSTLTAEDSFRVGSITKIFTSTLVLTLVDEGKVDLDAPAATYITRVDIPADITVRQLLNHTSGLPNYMDADAYYGEVTADYARHWTPEEILGLITGMPVAEAGSNFAYANTNYIFLGILIEEVTGEAYDKVLTDRILEPLKLEHTWLDGYMTGTAPVTPWTQTDTGYGPMTTDYATYATSTWSAGALVSTVADLHTFMTGLSDGTLIKEETLKEMTDAPAWGYGLGVIPFSDTGDEFGHLGEMPGFLSFVAHSSTTGRTAFWVITNGATDYSPALSDILTRINMP